MLNICFLETQSNDFETIENLVFKFHQLRVRARASPHPNPNLLENGRVAVTECHISERSLFSDPYDINPARFRSSPLIPTKVLFNSKWSLSERISVEP